MQTIESPKHISVVNFSYLSSMRSNNVIATDSSAAGRCQSAERCCSSW